MGASPPEQSASGSGITTQRSVLPDDITQSSQDQFRNSLSSAAGQTYNLGNNIPNYQSNVNLLSRGTAYDLGTNLSPVVQGQLSQQYQDSALGAQARNQRIADMVGNNANLAGALQAENLTNSALGNNSMRLAALGQQVELDKQSAALDLQRMAQYNQAQLDAGNFANNALNQKYQNQIQSTQAQQALLELLGKGLITTAPQIQGNFTIDDLNKLQSNPSLLDPYLYGGGGLLSSGQINSLNGQPASIAGSFGTVGQRYVQGKGWTMDGVTYQNGSYPGVAKL